jgi:hypothetical protein
MLAREESRKRIRMEEAFYCRARRRRLTLGKCLDDYMNANAFEDKKSCCWKCPQGRRNRTEFSGEDPSAG